MGQISQDEAMEAQAALKDNIENFCNKRATLKQRILISRSGNLGWSFLQAQGRNRSRLTSGNVAITSGSALNVSLGNIDRFA